MRPVIAFSLLLSISLVNAADKPASVKFCHENNESYPWLVADRPGLNLIMMKQVEKQLGTKVELAALPWKRCLDELKNGTVDGAFKSSFKADRLEFGLYPMQGDKPDTSKRMLDESYTLYKLKGSKLDWDGKTLKADGSVGAQLGFSVVEQLKGMGVKVDDGARSADDNLKKLLAGRVSAVALQTQEADNTIAGSTEFRDKVEKVSPPLSEKPYFLMLSKQFVAKHPDFARQVWDTVAQVRESAEYKKQVQQFR
ncbi:substrate-binding periplasmic protein [Chitinimonas lacunae]|uniref:Substrate-binding periplasmic protein n=1 Tax=Chitinimonas lacunae TaxID=1963018 RepID=A0ABV8MSE9_9NEIS